MEPLSRLNLISFAFSLFGTFLVSGNNSPWSCAFFKQSLPLEGQKWTDLLVDGTKTRETCNKGASCYAFWKQETSSDNSSRILVTRGCWETSGSGTECSSNVCQPVSHSNKAMEKARFCCCSGYLCNLNITITLPISDRSAEVQPHQNVTVSKTSDGGHTKAILFGGAGGIFILLILACIAFKWGPDMQEKQNQLKSNKHHSLESPHSSSKKMVSFSQLSLERIIGQGKYGTVWLGYLKDQPVAIKMFPSHYQHYFYNEKDIYTLPFMEHSSLLTYFGDDKMKNKEGMTNHFLVLSYCPTGTLQDYLKSNVVDLNAFAKMALSISSALSFLHTEIHKDGLKKPCITHRDINSRNILIREDHHCYLADLSLAVKISGIHYYSLGDELHAETKSINDVGTLRYMAPEILEGAVNLRDCESSMKQIDVYALGLVLWELAMRVKDFFNKLSDVPPYAMPFEKEVGLHPTFEEMQVLVCRNKARPLYPFEWKNCSSTRAIRETIEDCTDQDGEARLTALCVHERIYQMQKGSVPGGNITPTQNATGFTSSGIYSNYCYHNHISFVPDHSNGNKEITDGCLSEDTSETLLTVTPSNSFNTQQNLYARDVAIIHPHQGRNPCMERNLLNNSGVKEKESSIVQASSKDSSSRSYEVEIEQTPRPSNNNLTSIPILQNRPFSSPKLVNLQPKETKDDYKIVSSLFKLIKKKNDNEDEDLTHVLVSPFENDSAAACRPSSLQLLSSSVEEEDESGLINDKVLKELSSRIRTPGDLPPSVRKKRGLKARLSLYDDRMMSYNDIDTTF